jgi:hypothetical protein
MEGGGKAPLFLTSALDGGECSASRPGRFTPGIHWRAPESVWTLWTTDKSRAAGNRTRAVQPVARCYSAK